MPLSVKEKPNKYDAIVVLLVLALALMLAARSVLFRGPQDAGELTVVVEIDGAEVDRFPLTSLENRTYSANGVTLTLAPGVSGAEPSSAFAPEDFERGIAVAVSDCPTRDCVRTGAITKAGQAIVCLPGRIVITLEGASAADYDIITG